MEDPLGNRMKEQYENRTRYCLPRRTYTIIRLDGKAFHSYTRELQKPFDEGLIADIDQSIIGILPEFQGAQLAYTQSDEISILLTDFATEQTCAWFDGNIQKITSVSASLITAEFNMLRLAKGKPYILGHFDARAFTIPDRTEVENYFIWRQIDCIRNSISMVAQFLYSHKELHGKSSAEKQEMIFQKGINWAEYPENLKNGRIIIKKKVDVPTDDGEVVQRSKWDVFAAPVFTRQRDFLSGLIPKYP